ncbi:putative extracelular serine [Diaporthe ampelina]|uniref:Putative extracelular serine n=1 Tax=Diaporthe ampelina TaxID=1214573 RepID=A0A0G2FR72_9PEZI|nr:putative extracelular serine [Diaporthe ampelina]
MKAGEASGDYRFPLLEKGILYQLASAHGGIGVILEHRYYGTSFPFEDISVEDARFLTTEQSLADAAYFARNVVFPGLENENLTSSDAPWIVYGVSYSGGQSAFLRKLYPDVFWGGISSSGVTEAIIDYWRYLEPIRQYGPADCIWTQQFITDVVDKIFIDSKNETLKGQFKLFFNYATTALDQNFVNNLYAGLYSWQGRNWDSTIGSGTFSNWCKLITSTKLEYSSSAADNASAAAILEATGYGGNDTLTLRLLNYAGYLGRSSLADAGPVDESASTSASLAATAVPAEQFDSWSYQTCTEWGYWVTGSGFDSSLGKPLLSRILDLEFQNSYCESLFGIVTPPNVTAINKYGGFDISYPRLAIINGLADPWREATPAADAAPPRESTVSEPWILIDNPPEDVWDGLRGAGHHWEANGVFANQTQEKQPPKAIAEAQDDIVEFVGAWIEEWKDSKTQ